MEDQCSTCRCELLVSGAGLQGLEACGRCYFAWMHCNDNCVVVFPFQFGCHVLAVVSYGLRMKQTDFLPSAFGSGPPLKQRKRQSRLPSLES